MNSNMVLLEINKIKKHIIRLSGLYMVQKIKTH